jgi:hypothetical protein
MDDLLEADFCPGTILGIACHPTGISPHDALESPWGYANFVP